MKKDVTTINNPSISANYTDFMLDIIIIISKKSQYCSHREKPWLNNINERNE